MKLYKPQYQSQQQYPQQYSQQQYPQQQYPQQHSQQNNYRQKHSSYPAPGSTTSVSTTWGTKHFVNYSFEQLTEWIKKNPYKNITVGTVGNVGGNTRVLPTETHKNEHILSPVVSSESSQLSLQPLQPLQLPPFPQQESLAYPNITLIKEKSTYQWLLLSAWLQSIDFRTGISTTITLHNITTEFQTRIQDGVFTGTKLQRKKKIINDGIAGLLNTNPPVYQNEQAKAPVIEAICRLTGDSGYQWILYDQATGSIDMYPTGISQWSSSSEIPTAVGSKDGTWIYTGKIANLAKWIENKEYNTELPAPSNKKVIFTCFENDEYINTKTKAELLQEFESNHLADLPVIKMTTKDLQQKKKDELIFILTRLKFMVIANKIQIGISN